MLKPSFIIHNPPPLDKLSGLCPGIASERKEEKSEKPTAKPAISGHAEVGGDSRGSGCQSRKPALREKTAVPRTRGNGFRACVRQGRR